MLERSIVDGAGPEPALATRIDEACDRFEAAWAAGHRARIEEVLEAEPEAERPELLRHLMAVELAYRRRRGEHPTPEEYRRRFPVSAALIDPLFASPPARPPGPLGQAQAVATEAASRHDCGSPRAGDTATTATPCSWPAVADFEVLGELGRGGMGVVYKAWQRSLNRLIALKMIRAGGQDNQDLSARFRIEAEVMARLRHPHIVRTYGTGDAGGRPFLVLELLEGGNLRAQLGGHPRPGHQAAALVVTLSAAMHAAHQSGIVHRDLKPANILFTADGVPKISDFGLAKLLEEEGQTETGQVLGTPSYMAPEQARGEAKHAGPAADVYALGAIFYEMLTGRPPFQGETHAEAVRRVVEDDLVPPSRLQSRVPRELEMICLKCLAKEPYCRYATAAALAVDLRRYLTDGDGGQSR